MPSLFNEIMMLTDKGYDIQFPPRLGTKGGQRVRVWNPDGTKSAHFEVKDPTEDNIMFGLKEAVHRLRFEKK